MLYSYKPIPVTVPDMVFSAIIALLGIGLVAVPTGIISAGFTELNGKEKEDKEKAEEEEEEEEEEDDEKA